MLRLSDHLRSVSSADGGVSLDLKQGRIFRSNRTGAVVLEMLAKGETEEAVVREVSRRFGSDPAIVSADVREFLACLKDNHLLIEGSRE